jgi:hypothetical protein
MEELRNLGKEKIEEVFEKTLKNLTGNEYEVELDQVWMRGAWITISIAARKKESGEVNAR